MKTETEIKAEIELLQTKKNELRFDRANARKVNPTKYAELTEDISALNDVINKLKWSIGQAY